MRPVKAADGYGELQVAPVEIVTNGGSAESVDLSSVLTGRSRKCDGNGTICVSVEFSTAAATCVIACILRMSDNTLVGVQTGTATATAYRVSGSGDYVGGTLAFDSFGAQKYEIRHGLPSAGTVDIFAWACGPESADSA